MPEVLKLAWCFSLKILPSQQSPIHGSMIWLSAVFHCRDSCIHQLLLYTVIYFKSCTIPIGKHPGKSDSIIQKKSHSKVNTIFFSFILFYSFPIAIKAYEELLTKQRNASFLLLKTQKLISLEVQSCYSQTILHYGLLGKEKKNHNKIPCWDNTVDDLEAIRKKKKVN